MRKLAGDETCKLFFHDDDEVEYIEVLIIIFI